MQIIRLRFPKPISDVAVLLNTNKRKQLISRETRRKDASKGGVPIVGASGLVFGLLRSSMVYII